jgi:hypothetical protein
LWCSLAWKLQFEKWRSRTGGSHLGHTSGVVRRQLCTSTVISHAWTAPAFLNSHQPMSGCPQLPLSKQQCGHRMAPLQTTWFLEALPWRKVVKHREFSEKFGILEKFLVGLHKVHLAYRMVNAGWAGVFNRVPTLCNQLLPHLLADILQTLHSCYGHIEDVHVTIWKCWDIFWKISM